MTLRLQPLEARDVPATFGMPWPDASRLSVSFVPDGTAVGAGETSRLFATLDAVMPRAAWQREVLRGVQAWAAHTGLDVVVVPDSGDPLGTPGRAQADPRFGDVRVAGLPLSPGSVSESVPFAGAAGTWAGDVLFNTALGLGSEYDLATVMMHEAAHVLGVGGSLTDPADVLFEYYTGPKAEPTPNDVAALRALREPRPADRFEGVGAFREAALRSYVRALADMDEDAAVDRDLPFAVDADLSIGDVDEFSYTAWGPFTVRLETAGRSLLAGRVSVIDAAGRVVEPSAARPGARYTLRVEADDADFAAGAYRLVVRDRPDLLTELVQRFAARRNANDTPGRATALALGDAYHGRFDRAGDVDFYRLAPLTGTSLDVQCWGGTVTLIDAAGRTVAAGAGELRVGGLTAGARYILRVTGAGAYLVAAREGVPAPVPDVVAGGTLATGDEQHFRGIYLPQSGVVRLDVALSAAAGTAVEATLFDMAGNAVWSRTLTGGSADVVLHLPRGGYTLRLAGASADGGPWQGGYEVRATRLSEPIGPKLIDPTQPPPTRPLTPVWFGGGFFNTLLLIDPFGRPMPFLQPPAVVTLPPGW